MNRTSTTWRWPVVLAVAVAVMSLAVGMAWAEPATTEAQAAPQQGTMSCSWRNIGQSSKSLFHTASAMDTDNNMMYIYGGVNGSFEVQDSVDVADLSGATLSANHRPVSAGQARDLVGAAGAYRAKGKDSDDSAAYFFGGLGDPASGRPDNDVQRYLTKAGTWEVVNVSTGSFAARYFAAAAYDPGHDVLWVTGGVANCALPDVLAGNTCRATSLATNYLSFDATTGEAQWNTLSGGNQSLYAHTMVYDAANTRMLLFGGTNDINRGNSSLKALDLSDPDPANATFMNVSTSGSAPTAFFHGSAYDPGNNWMIVFGGVRQEFLRNNESLNTQTWALDLGQTPPMWTDLNAPWSGGRVAGAMEFDPMHNAAVFALGRQKYNGDPTRPQSVQRTTYGLECMLVTPTTAPPTNTPRPTNIPGTPGGPGGATWAAPAPQPEACDFISNRVPAAAIAAALGSPPAEFALCNPGLPISPFNGYKDKLGLVNNNQTYHPLFNGLTWRCGCP